MKLFSVLCVTLCMSTLAQTLDGAGIQNLLASPPFNDAGMGKKVLVDRADLLMMQVALKPGQRVPQHNANSNVHIIVLEGEVVINLAGKDFVVKKGDFIPVAFKTPMNIKNASQEKATFVIIKTPNPDQMEQ